MFLIIRPTPWRSGELSFSTDEKTGKIFGANPNLLLRRRENRINVAASASGSIAILPFNFRAAISSGRFDRAAASPEISKKSSVEFAARSRAAFSDEPDRKA